MGPDVVMNLNGGFGNQLFQYAATLKALRETGGSTFELLMIEGHYRPNISDFIDVRHRAPARLDRARWSELALAPGPLRPAFRRTALINERYTSRLLLKQVSPFDRYQPLPLGGQVKLEGFFQHPQWWADDWAAVAQMLLAQAPAGFDELVTERRTIIGLRQRADYVREGWALPIEYYEHVLERLRTDDRREVVVVADEPNFVPWFSRLLEHEGFAVLPAARLHEDDSANDFWNVAAGAVLAIPNSTFSWWAAATATRRNEDTRVLYPAPWIVNQWTDEPTPLMGLTNWSPLQADILEFA